jgi:hypothetical protein
MAEVTLSPFFQLATGTPRTSVLRTSDLIDKTERPEERLRSVIAESVLIKHQLLIVNRFRRRAPNILVWDRLIGTIRRECLDQGPRAPMRQ